jgi:hypothetical protein
MMLKLRNKYQVMILNGFAALENFDENVDISQTWENIRENIEISAKASIGHVS